MTKRRPIDRRRDAAFTIEVGAPDDNSGIKEFIVIGGVMHVVKGSLIYRIVLADAIDPERTNADLSTVQQKVL